MDPLSFVVGAVFGALVAWGLVWRTLREAASGRRRRARGDFYLSDRVW